MDFLYFIMSHEIRSEQHSIALSPFAFRTLCFVHEWKHFAFTSCVGLHGNLLCGSLNDQRWSGDPRHNRGEE